jgi:hypothetical protein
MKMPGPTISLCVALATAECGWNAPPHSDFITSGAGDSVATTRVLQAEEIWPPVALDTDIIFDTSRFLNTTKPMPEEGQKPAPMSGAN